VHSLEAEPSPAKLSGAHGNNSPQGIGGVQVKEIFACRGTAQQDDTPFVILPNEGGKGTFFLG
jgi:hypothetical protein